MFYCFASNLVARVAVLVVLGATVNAQPLRQQPPAPVRVQVVVSEEVQDLRSVSGNVRATQRAMVATEESGLVLELLAREGERVEKGQPLARLDAKRLELELVRSRAEESLAAATLVEREVALERTRRDLEILQELARRDAGNPRELADAASDVRGAEARLEQATAERAVAVARRELLEQRLADMQPTAPFDGVVIARRTEAGEWIAAGGVLLELVSTESPEVWLDVPGSLLPSLRELQGSVRVTADASGEALDVTDWRLVPDVDPRARTFRMIGRLPAEGVLVPGMAVTGAVPSGVRREHLLVSPDAILRAETGPYVYFVAPAMQGEGHMAMTMPVEVLFHIGGRVAVRAPRLEVGMQVVVEGNERLHPTRAIVPQEIGSR